jgi:hypothetical protein
MQKCPAAFGALGNGTRFGALTRVLFRKTHHPMGLRH